MKKYIVLVLMIVVLVFGCSQEKEDSLDQLLDYKETYIGNASDIGAILVMLDIEHDGIELKTDEEPYGLIINLSKEVDDIDYTSACLMMLVDNMSYIEYDYDDTSIMVERLDIEDKYGYDLRTLVDDKEKLLSVLSE